MRRAGLTCDGDPRVKPPFGAAEVDWGHRRVRDPRALWLFSEAAGASAQDVIMRRHAAWVGSAQHYGVGQPGYVATLPDAATDYAEAPTSGLQGFARLTIAAHIFWRGTPTGFNDSNLFTNVTAEASPIDPYQVVALALLGASGTPGQVVFALSTGVAGSRITLASAEVVSTNRWTSIAVTWDGATMRAFIDGRQSVTTSTFSGTTGTNSIPPRIGLSGAYWGIDRTPFNGDIDYLYVQGAAWSAYDALEQHAEPYAMLRPRVARRYFVPAAAAVSGMLPYAPRRRRLIA